MEEEVLQPVLSEMLEELKEVRKQQAYMQKVFIEATDKLAEREADLTAAKKRDWELTVGSITSIMNAGFNQIISVVEAQPKNITNNIEWSFFPNIML